LIHRTWTPDWTTAPNFTPLLHYFWKHSYFKDLEYSPYDGPCFSFSSSGTEKVKFVFAHDLSTLTVRGFKWDVVELVSANMSECVFDESLRPCEEELHSLYKFSKETHDESALSHFKERLWFSLAPFSHSLDFDICAPMWDWILDLWILRWGSRGRYSYPPDTAHADRDLIQVKASMEAPLKCLGMKARFSLTRTGSFSRSVEITGIW
jgi:hypothetical protein